MLPELDTLAGAAIFAASMAASTLCVISLGHAVSGYLASFRSALQYDSIVQAVLQQAPQGADASSVASAIAASSPSGAGLVRVGQRPKCAGGGFRRIIEIGGYMYCASVNT